MSYKEQVLQWLAENQPSLKLEDVYSFGLAGLILEKAGLKITHDEAKEIFPNLGLFSPPGLRLGD